MLELNKDAYIASLSDQRLQQLALGIYEFQLVFNDNARISIQQSLQVERSGKEAMNIRADVPEQTKELFFLLGRVVQGIEITHTGALKIVFDDQTRMTIHPATAGSDAYVVWIKGQPFPG